MTPTIGIAVYTCNRPKILHQTLTSYSIEFLNCFDQKILLLNGNDTESRDIAKQFSFEIYSTSNRMGIGNSIEFVVDKLNTDYILVCQDDFLLCEKEVNHEILDAIDLIEKGLINCYRTRSLLKPGFPMSSGKRLTVKDGGNLEETHYSGYLYYNFVSKPETKHPDIFNYIEKRNMYVLSSKNANYTENPCIYKKSWYKDHISKYNNISGRNAENNVQTFWEKNDFKVGMGRGFFTHQDKVL